MMSKNKNRDFYASCLVISFNDTLYSQGSKPRNRLKTKVESHTIFKTVSISFNNASVISKADLNQTFTSYPSPPPFFLKYTFYIFFITPLFLFFSFTRVQLFIKKPFKQTHKMPLYSPCKNMCIK